MNGAATPAFSEPLSPETQLAIETLQSTLQKDIASATSPVGIVKSALQTASSLFNERFSEGDDVRALVGARAQFMDFVLTQLWLGFDWDRVDNVALLAVGGYGRGELHPHSDIDLLIVSKLALNEHEQDQISRFITLLWDLNLDIGQSVRTLTECVSEAQKDLTIATNLLETRTISGPEALRDALNEHVFTDEVYSDKAYFVGKREEQKIRHEKFGDTEYNLEPNLKSSPGALRDIQTIGWITKRHFRITEKDQLSEYQFLTDEEYAMLRDGETFLWKMRYGLQVIAGRNENRLLFDHQRALAEMLGYRDSQRKLGVEIMMQKYYRVVLALAELTDVMLQYFDEAIIKNSYSDDEVTRLNKRFVVRNRYIEANNNGVFAYAPYALLEIFVLIAQNPQIKGIRATTIRAIRAHRHLIDKEFRNDLASTTLFMELLKTPHALHRTLSFMKRYNVLGRYLPEFGKIIGQMQHDLFHIYTVDAHTVRVIKNMVSFRDPNSKQHFPLATRLIRRLPKLELLYIAGLYHDIGKGRGGDHSDLGARDVEAFCSRHHLSQRDTQLVSWLVKHHLLMSMTAQRKDTQDPDVIYQFAREIPSLVHLDYLYVLTVADIEATNPSLWNSWRASLLRQLYLEARRVLSRGVEKAIDRNEWIQATKEEALTTLVAQHYTEQEVMQLWDQIEDDYFLQDSTSEIAWQTAAILRHGDPSIPLILIRDISNAGQEISTQIMIYVKSSLDLFAATTAVLEQVNLNILDARISADSGPFNLSSFIVLDENHQPLAGDSERKQRIRERLIDELDDPEDYPSIIKRRTPRQLKHFTFPTEVTFSNDTINQRTIMEVITPDRPGLLARIGRILLDFNVSLVAARIATLGERVEDVFFITMADGSPISDPQLCTSLAREICQQLDEQVRAE
ncbi:PII uridylyl-transferase [Oleiphilus messinensis]|uniref:Bifunctional uridylyltransferase/uridylyl-removing enzyme n=1 Tax=Oleiphilus messinensis TaxID=141451 RepID=A0A1Y0I6I2_9GAMM|nr:[protein-PII] uridylyltransferase [Oleiphilus messinensis]ARU56041.1 PII uridylyl-transferase [Oleiphilus messinensis]